MHPNGPPGRPAEPFEEIILLDGGDDAHRPKPIQPCSASFYCREPSARQSQGVDGPSRNSRASGSRSCAHFVVSADKWLLDMLGVFAEFETNFRRERQLEGIAMADAAGVYKGRPASIDAAQVRQLKADGVSPS